MKPTNSSFFALVTENARFFAISVVIFLAIALGAFALTPRPELARSVVQVAAAPFDFKTIATGNDIAARVAAGVPLPGGLAAASGNIAVEPITAPFAYTTSYPDLLSVETKASTGDLAIAMNTAVLNDAFETYSHIHGKAAIMSIIDKPYLVQVSRTKELLKYALAGIIVGAALAYVFLWLRGRGRTGTP